MNYEDALQYIHGLERFGSKPGLDRIKALTSRLGNPQNHLSFVHIAGTNGKGSTAAFTAGILACAGYNTGLYTSPFIVRFNERIRLNGTEISDADLARTVSRIKAVIDQMVQEGLEHPTEFEVVTALAFLYYHEKKCDVVVLEVGMGGQFDATNVISEAAVSVITKIAMDHTEILGDTLAKIAFEKAGIIKPNGKAVIYPQEKTALDTIKAVCSQRNAGIYHANPDELTDIELKRGLLSFRHPHYGLIDTHIVGVHQVYNAAVAIRTIEVMNTIGFNIEPDHIRQGFAKASWPGRFELLRKNPDFYIDGGHNPDGIRSFIDTFRAVYPGKKAIVIFGVMKDKEYEVMIKELSVITDKFIAVTPNTPRALPAESLAKLMHKYCKDVECSVTIEEAVKKSFLLASRDDIIAALGSLYYIGQVRTMICTTSSS